MFDESSAQRMRVTQRYIVVVVVCVVAALLVSLWSSAAPRSGRPDRRRSPSFAPLRPAPYASVQSAYEVDAREYRDSRPAHGGGDDDPYFDPDKCRMSTCFDYGRCKSAPDFKVYVYPINSTEKMSPIYAEILQVSIKIELL